MQKPNLKLKEIIWEITDKCYNGCSYCGSRDILNKTPLIEENILKIATKIAMYPPEEVNISGGDPLIVSQRLTAQVINTLKASGCIVKVIVNPRSINKDSIEKLRLYDWIGLSINNSAELDLASHVVGWDSGHSPWDKFTVITNFNTSNIFMYEKIEEFVKAQNVPWQIQYTMTGDGTSIYDNEQARIYFFEKISKSYSSGVQLSLADNLNCGTCSAGLHSLGILANGTVVPCLSMRSWSDNLDYQGSLGLGEMSLKGIWETGFQNQRFCEFKCCKDICNAPYIGSNIITTTKLDFGDPYKIYPDKTTVMAYGVITNPWNETPWSNPFTTTMVYGVSTGNMTYKKED